MAQPNFHALLLLLLLLLLLPVRGHGSMVPRGGRAVDRRLQVYREQRGGAPHATYGPDSEQEPYDARTDRRTEHRTAPHGTVNYRKTPHGTPNKHRGLPFLSPSQAV
jgi:hypothetical protein